ncbi:hypothetical protein D9756_003398 [Leucocoprinus leucothites]|uniref:Uncharacterized protein n=1 Tax=Leucocoprinus leucothites TaxID=201217 RepID=A0A8H5G6P4_9AGAR|nr:hypothetical protein D9756_003398 [Leucoagaricus leucothites]
MSELDSLSDSDWLDISSRTSDDNDSVSSHDGLSSRPLSRRSSVSFGSSHESEVEAWEGFVEESGDESALESGMCIVRPLTAGVSESTPAGTIPDISAHDPADDQRVKEALDQSIVGTLSASRTSTTGHSSHNSIRDLRLSFPDPLTSSRDQLNRSYQEVPDSETLSATNDADTTISLSDSGLSSSEHEPEGAAITSQGPHHEVTQQDNNNTNIGLDVILYGSSSPIKWSFVQDLIQKAANFSGNVVLSTLDPSAGPVQTLELRCEKDNSILTSITVHDCTNDNANSTDTLDLQDDVMRASLAIVYLPAATLPVLSLHNAYLPVLVPALPASADQAGSVLRHAAEDDWELLGVPVNRTIFLNSDKTPVMSTDALSRLESWKAFEVIRSVLDSPAQQIKATSDNNGHPTRAVTLFALVSIMMGVAFNTAFHSPVPVGPPGTVRVSGNTWGAFQGGQFNRSLAVPFAGTSTALATSSSKDFSLSVLSPGITSLSFSSPQVNSLSITSRINSLSVNNHPSSLSPVYTPTSLAVPGPSRLPIAASDAPRASSSKDVLVRPATVTSLSEVNSLLSATRTEKKRARPDFTTTNALSLRFSNSLSEAMDIGAKIFTNAARFENGVKDLVNSIQAQTQTVVTQSKGKARALGEEVISRNDRARGRAKELRKKGEELLSSASVQFFERTEIAKQRAKILKDTFKQTEAWKSYERVHADFTAKKKAMEQCAKDKPGWLVKRDSGGGWAGCMRSAPLPVH